MKKKTYPFIVVLPLIIMMMCWGCMKKEDPKPTPEAAKTTEMKISPTFNWSTTRPVDLKITGIPGALNNNKTLSLHSGGKVYYKELYNINQNLNRRFYVPVLINNLTLEYGGYVKSLDIINGLVEHSFIPVIIDE